LLIGIKKYHYDIPLLNFIGLALDMLLTSLDYNSLTAELK